MLRTPYSRSMSTRGLDAVMTGGKESSFRLRYRTVVISRDRLRFIVRAPVTLAWESGSSSRGMLGLMDELCGIGCRVLLKRVRRDLV
jgi:hypothetical protein